MADCPTELSHHLQADDRVELAWLYGSRATGQFSAHSDWDIAVALTPHCLQNGAFYAVVDDLNASLQAALSEPVSVIDINHVPVPLAYNVIRDGQVILCRSDFRLRAEEQRVWSLWEAFKREHERERQTL